jgi:hypothetical protein
MGRKRKRDEDDGSSGESSTSSEYEYNGSSDDDSEDEDDDDERNLQATLAASRAATKKGKSKKRGSVPSFSSDGSSSDDDSDSDGGGTAAGSSAAHAAADDRDYDEEKEKAFSSQGPSSWAARWAARSDGSSSDVDNDSEYNGSSDDDSEDEDDDDERNLQATLAASRAATKKGKSKNRALGSAVTDSDLVQVDGLNKLPPRRGRKSSKRPPLHDAIKHARAQYKMDASGKNRKSFVAAIQKYHHRFTGSNSERIFSQLVRADAPKSAAQIEKIKKTSEKWNAENNAKWNAKAKEKREAKLQTALLLHTNEGTGFTVAEARAEAKRLLKTHLAALPNVVEKICVGMKNFDSNRRQQNYTRNKRWEATGAKSCTYAPITAYHTYNQLSCRRMEHAIMKELEKYHVLHNKNGGGGGTLGIRNGSGAETVRMADGKPQWLSDPKGYVVYLVFVPAC